MKHKSVQIGDYLFSMKFFGKDAPTKVVSSNFEYLVFPKRDMTKEELEKGHSLQEEIFRGEWDSLIAKSDIKIELDIYGIVITLDTVQYNTDTFVTYYNGGSIEHDLTEICPHCHNKECNFDCPDSLEWASDRDTDTCISNNKELENKRICNFALDAIASMILSHAVAGMDVTTPAYGEGIETAVDAVANHI